MCSKAAITENKTQMVIRIWNHHECVCFFINTVCVFKVVPVVGRNLPQTLMLVVFPINIFKHTIIIIKSVLHPNMIMPMKPYTFRKTFL